MLSRMRRAWVGAVVLLGSLSASAQPRPSTSARRAQAFAGAAGLGLGAGALVGLVGAAAASDADLVARWRSVAPWLPTAALVSLVGYGAVLGAPLGAVLLGRRSGGYGAYTASLLGSLAGATLGVGAAVGLYALACPEARDRCEGVTVAGLGVGIVLVAAGAVVGYELSHRGRAAQSPPPSPWVRLAPGPSLSLEGQF